MARYRSWWKSSLVLAVLAALPALAVEIPAGAELQLRLKSKVSSSASKPKDPVEAVLISPVAVDGKFVIPAGTVVRGVVVEAKSAPSPKERAVLGLTFSELDLGTRKLKLNALVASVDNARESVDEKGQIQGILASETISGRLDAGIGRVAERYEGFASILEAAKDSMLKAPEADISYEPGVELNLKLAQPLKIDNPPRAEPELEPLAEETRLLAMVAAQPFRTMAERPSKPSDITNLMYLGSEEELRNAFQQAGWSAAAALSTQTKVETVRAVAELRGYKEAPVSVLLLDGKPPDMVFEKQNNTFAMRHHLRIWRRPVTFAGQAVWVCAATHDVGIDFSQEERTFIHKIDPQIDRERAKVVNDLLLTGLVKSLALVDRPEVPLEGQNATGDKLITDGRLAVVILK
jgi:hypothetical protein